MNSKESISIDQLAMNISSKMSMEILIDKINTMSDLMNVLKDYDDESHYYSKKVLEQIIEERKSDGVYIQLCACSASVFYTYDYMPVCPSCGLDFIKKDEKELKAIAEAPGTPDLENVGSMSPDELEQWMKKYGGK